MIQRYCYQCLCGSVVVRAGHITLVEGTKGQPNGCRGVSGFGSRRKMEAAEWMSRSESFGLKVQDGGS